jgi:hypothetical protein
MVQGRLKWQSIFDFYEVQEGKRDDKRMWNRKIAQNLKDKGLDK